MSKSSLKQIVKQEIVKSNTDGEKLSRREKLAAVRKANRALAEALNLMSQRRESNRSRK
jgi:hypothetical protein